MKKIIILFLLSINLSFSIEKYIMAHNKRIDNGTAKYIVKEVMINSKQYNMNPYLVLAVMQTESNFNHNIVSSAGAKGLMQLMPFNFSEFNVDNTISGNIKGGILHLSRDFKKTQNIKDTLICYNAGCGRLKNDKWKSIKETREYIVKVNKNYNKIMKYIGKEQKDILTKKDILVDITKKNKSQNMNITFINRGKKSAIYTQKGEEK